MECATGDEAGECRALANLGAAHLSRGDLTLALERHNAQLQLAMRLQDQETIVAALAALGHVYTAQGDFRSALSNHRQCALVCRQLGNRLEEAHQVGCMGAVYTALQELDAALDCHRVHLRAAEAAANPEERCRAPLQSGRGFIGSGRLSRSRGSFSSGAAPEQWTGGKRCRLESCAGGAGARWAGTRRATAR